MRDTIFALSSGMLPSGVALIRLSGPRTRIVCETMAAPLGPARQACLRGIRHPDGALLDRGFLIWFPAPESFTGEDCAEFHLHGGKAVVASVLNTLAGFDGLRLAEPGEFTRRAFMNGKLDLAQAEALADLIAADTEAARRFALANADGRQGELYRRWRQQLVGARALVEAELDFSDEGDVPDAASASVWAALSALAGEIRTHCRDFRRAEVVRDGLDVVIVGAPNAGKSSLLNALARRDVAIVSAEAGTTRDLIEVTLDIEGYRVRVTDTAGLREAASGVEQEGISRALARARRADLVLHLQDMTAERETPNVEDVTKIIQLGSKADLANDTAGLDFHLVISAVDGRGIDELLELMKAEAATAAPSSEIVPSQVRQVTLLTEAASHIEAALEPAAPFEVKAEELRLASTSLGKITGEIGVEDLLGAIFSTFCIGK